MNFSHNFILISILSCLYLLCCADKVPPQFEVDLGLPPHDRWLEVYRSLGSNQDMIDAFHLISSNFMENSAPGCDDKCIIRVNNAFKMRFPDYYEELRGISEVAWYLNLTLEQLVYFQSLYEFEILNLTGQSADNDLQLPFWGPGCTSVLTCDARGNVMHGRNLDWDNAQLLAQTMFRINYTLNKKLIFQSDQLCGVIGILTAARPIGFSMSLNARELESNPPLDQFLDCLETVPLQPILPGFRYYMENFETYEDVYENITNTPYCAPRYSIIGGTNGRGVRFQHNMGTDYEQHSILIDKEELQCTDNSWFIAQCNSDLDFPRSNDTRRDKVMSELETEGRDYGCSTVGLFRAMTVPKVKNVYTVHTSILSPVTGSIVTVAYDI